MKRKKLLCAILTLAFTLSVINGLAVNAKKAPKLSKSKVTLYVGKSTTLKVKNSKKKVKWSSTKKSVATVTSKGKVKAKKKGTAYIKAKVEKKTLKCKVTVKEKYIDKRSATLVENFESYDVGYDWPVYTLGEGLTSGNSEPAHYLAKDETMKVVADPENPSNKVLQVKPKFYSFAPVLTVDLAKLTGDATQTLANYSGVRAKLRVVSDASTHVGIGFGAFFGKAGSIDKRYAFMTYTEQENALPAERPFYIFHQAKAMATGAQAKDKSMPYFAGDKSTAGHKLEEKDKAVGFSTQTLNFTKYLTDDIKNQSTFDMVLGGSYGKASSGEYLAWYIDDIELLK